MDPVREAENVVNDPALEARLAMVEENTERVMTGVLTQALRGVLTQVGVDAWGRVLAEALGRVAVEELPDGGNAPDFMATAGARIQAQAEEVRAIVEARRARDRELLALIEGLDDAAHWALVNRLGL
jgi:hypothetical protein